MGQYYPYFIVHQIRNTAFDVQMGFCMNLGTTQRAEVNFFVFRKKHKEGVNPQDLSLNSGQWQTLEKKVRDWANRYGSVIVYTGPIVLDNVYGTIGYNKVVVPDAFFKAILAGEQSIAFVMYNHNNNENMQKCALSVDDLEALSGIDFFAELDDDFENRVEATYNLRNWGL